MLRINNLLLGSAGPANLRLDQVSSATDLSSAFDLGFASFDRVIIVCLGWQTSSSTLASATIAGVAATIIAQAGGALASAIIAAHVPAGTSGTITATLSGAGAIAGAVVYALYGRQTAGVTQNDAATVATGTMTATIAVPANGIAIGCCCYNKNDTTAWTGLDLDTETHILAETVSAASKYFLTAQPSLSITAVPGSSPTGKSLVCASWGP